MVLVVTAVAVALLARVLYGFATADPGPAGSRAALLAPLAYLLLQTGSAALAAWSTALYGFALAMHYVEYHVLMVPRCFHAPLDGRSRPDRAFGLVRSRRPLFYGLLLLAAVPVTFVTWRGMGSPAVVPSGATATRFLIAAFDGLFVVHYVIEAKIWRFGDPFYRRSLIPLYFGQARPGQARARVRREPAAPAASEIGELGRVPATT